MKLGSKCYRSYRSIIDKNRAGGMSVRYVAMLLKRNGGKLRSARPNLGSIRGFLPVASATGATTSGGRCGTGMWADSPATTMSIVICAGVPRAPLVDSHHLHGPVPEAKAGSPARGLCYHLQAEQYTMRAANHLEVGIAARCPYFAIIEIESLFLRALHFFSGMNIYSRANDDE